MGAGRYLNGQVQSLTWLWCGRLGLQPHDVRRRRPAPRDPAQIDDDARPLGDHRVVDLGMRRDDHDEVGIAAVSSSGLLERSNSASAGTCGS